MAQPVYPQRAGGAVGVTPGPRLFTETLPQWETSVHSAEMNLAAEISGFFVTFYYSSNKSGSLHLFSSAWGCSSNSSQDSSQQVWPP